MFTLKIFVSFMLVYLAQCTGPIDKFHCDENKKQVGSFIRLKHTATEELCAKECSDTEGCISFNWYSNNLRCYMKGTPRSVAQLVDMPGVQSCEMNDEVRAAEVKSKESKKLYYLHLTNNHTGHSCTAWKNYKGDNKPIRTCEDLNTHAACWMSSYFTHPFIAWDCTTMQLLRFKEAFSGRTDLVAEGKAFGAHTYQWLHLTIIDAMPSTK